MRIDIAKTLEKNGKIQKKQLEKFDKIKRDRLKNQNKLGTNQEQIKNRIRKKNITKQIGKIERITKKK